MRRGRLTAGPGLRGPIACCVLAVAALSLGPKGEAVIRSTVRDAARPGFAIERQVATLTDAFDVTRWPWTAERPAMQVAGSAEANDELKAARREVRALRAALAAARHEKALLGRSLGPIRQPAGSSAFAVERIPASILHAAEEGVMAGGVLIGSGRSRGMERGQLAVEPVTLAAGTDDGFTDGGLVLAGAAVVGRTDEVGLWTATLLPVTDPEFRAHVSLVRDTDAGPVAGEEGILEGDGRGGCVIRYLPSTASVSVGDHVYSVDPTGRLPQPLYYGRIEQASLRRGAPHWDVTVRPAADPAALGTVHVLVPQIAAAARSVTMTD